MAYDRTLVQIRERSYLELLDLALMLIRQRPRALMIASAAGITPFALLNAWILSDPDFPRLLWAVLLYVEAPWATIPLTLTLGGLMFDRAPGVGAVLWRITRALPSLVFTHLLLRCLLGATVLLLPLVPGYLWFANEVILLEKAGGFEAIRRCSQLSRQRSGELFMQWLGQLCFGLLFALCFWAGTSAAASALTTSKITWERPFLSDISGVRFQLGIWIAIAFFGVARFLIYIDQRIRSEGWELKLRLQSVGHDLAGERS
jgi:hypothetical protein